MLEKAGVGSDDKSRRYGGGLVKTPAAACFAVQEKLVFGVEIPHILDLYKATEGIQEKMAYCLPVDAGKR